MRYGLTRTLALGLTAALLIAAAPAQAQDEIRRVQAVRVTAGGWFGFSFSEHHEGNGRSAVVTVLSVEPNSGAARGGLQRGDTIVRWNDRADVPAAIQAKRAEPGDTVRLRVRREGREQSLTMVAGERPRTTATSIQGRAIPIREARIRVLELDSLSRDLQMNADSLQRRLRVILRDSLGSRVKELERSAQFRSEQIAPRVREIQALATTMAARADSSVQFFALSSQRGVAGAELTELNPGLASYCGAGEGVLVLRVVPDTPAARAGLQAGDVVTHVDGQRVAGVREVSRAVGRATGRAAELSVVRKGRGETVRLRWE